MRVISRSSGEQARMFMAPDSSANGPPARRSPRSVRPSMNAALLVFKLTGSALNLAITSAATFLPYLLFGLVIGAWVDRVDRKRLMIGTDIARAAVIASIPLLASIDRLSVEWIYLDTFVSTTLSICFSAAEFAAIPSLVPRDSSEAIVSANGRIQASYSAAAVVGPLLAGALVAFIFIPLLLAVDAASFLLSAVSLGIIRLSFNVAKPC